MPQDQGELDATLLIEDKKGNIISNIASSWVYEKRVTNVRLSGKITDTKIEYSHLYSTSSLLPHWDTIHATGSTLISHSSRNQQPTRPSPSSSSNLLVTNYKPPRLTDKQSNTQVWTDTGTSTWAGRGTSNTGVARGSHPGQCPCPGVLVLRHIGVAGVVVLRHEGVASHKRSE